MKLYYAPGTCALAVHVALVWAGADYTLEKVQLGSEAYKKINPMGAVPALVDGDSGVMTQADSLLKYICRKYPAKQLGGPADTRHEQQLDQWLAFLSGDLHPAFGPLFNPAGFTTQTDEDSLEAVRAAARQRLGGVLSVLDQHLAGREYMLGAQKTVADPYAYIMVRWLGYMKIGKESWPNVQRHFDRMAQDPGVIQAETGQGMRQA